MVERKQVWGDKEIEEAKTFIRAFPFIYRRLINCAYDKSRSVCMFTASAWERHVVHALSTLIGLSHHPVKQDGTYSVYVHRNEDFSTDHVAFPESLWDTETIEEKSVSLLHPRASHLRLQFMQEHPHLYYALVSFTDGEEKEVVFSTLSQEERVALHFMSKTFSCIPQTVRMDDHYFVYVSKGGNLPISPRAQRVPLRIGEDQQWEYSIPEHLENIYRDQCVRNAKGETVRFQAGATTRACSYLQYLICTEGLVRSLEVGLAFGVSAMFCAQMHYKMNKNGIHTAIDPFQRSKTHWDSIGLLNIEKSGLNDFFKFIEKPSELALPQLISEEQMFDLVFIDGNHLYDHVFIDAFFAVKALQSGGFLVFDDTDLKPVQKTIQFIRKNYHMMVPVPQGCFDRTFTFQKIDSVDPRVWYFHSHS